MSLQFHCTSIEDYDNQHAAIVRGSLQTGPVSPGMSLCIQLSATFEMTIPIIDVLDSGELLIDCDDQEGVDNLLALGIADECLRIDC